MHGVYPRSARRHTFALGLWTLGVGCEVGMVTCNRCGAELPLDAWECPYCRTVTAHGFARREAEAAAFRAQAEADRARDHAFASAQRAEAERSLQRSSLHALLWSVFGFVLCCSPL